MALFDEGDAKGYDSIDNKSGDANLGYSAGGCMMTLFMLPYFAIKALLGSRHM